MSDTDAGSLEVDVLSPQAHSLTPAEAGVGTDQHQGLIPRPRRVDETLHLCSGQEARRLLALAGQRDLQGRIVGQSIIGNGCCQALAESEYSLPNGRRRQARIQQFGDPATDVAVRDLV